MSGPNWIIGSVTCVFVRALYSFCKKPGAQSLLACRLTSLRLCVGAFGRSYPVAFGAADSLEASRSALALKPFGRTEGEEREKPRVRYVRLVVKRR